MRTPSSSPTDPMLSEIKEAQPRLGERKKRRMRRREPDDETIQSYDCWERTLTPAPGRGQAQCDTTMRWRETRVKSRGRGRTGTGEWSGDRKGASGWGAWGVAGMLEEHNDSPQTTACPRAARPVGFKVRCKRRSNKHDP